MLRLTTQAASKRLAAFSAATVTTGSVYQYNQQYKLHTLAIAQAEPHRQSIQSVAIHSTRVDHESAIATSSSTSASIDSDQDTDSALWDALEKMEETTQQVKPLIEASARAAKLVQTVFLVIMDYQLDKYSHLNPFSEEDDVRANIKSLETTVQQRSEQLQEAQRTYAAGDAANVDDDNKKNDNYDTAVQTNKEVKKEERRQSVLKAARDLAQAEENLHQAQTQSRERDGSTTNIETDDTAHARAAQRIRDLCRSNGGTYIKVGQHLANLDHLLPPVYIQVLHSLFGDAPTTEYEDVREVIREELGAYPEHLFDEFEIDPIASASLAQVHVATKDGRKLAVKVQHRGLRETSKGDLMALEGVVRLVDRMFDDFKWGWIVDEIAPNLPKELDFEHEGKNAEAAEKAIQKAGLSADCIVPKVHWDLTASRVLVMDFEEGHSATDIREIENADICKKDLAVLISSVFQSQIFQSGFVHCDPHCSNVFWRQKPDGKGPQLILFDHGLYKQIDDNFRLTYAQLWKSLMLADIDGIKTSCSALGVYEMYPLLAAMLTSRPFDEVMERSKSKSFSVKATDSMDTKSDAAMIRGYAQQYLKEIIQMLDKVPRQMLLLFKMNDCLRHIDHALGSPANTIVVAGKYATKTVYDHDSRGANGRMERLRHWMSYFLIMCRIRVFEAASNAGLLGNIK